METGGGGQMSCIEDQREGHSMAATDASQTSCPAIASRQYLSPAGGNSTITTSATGHNGRSVATYEEM